MSEPNYSYLNLLSGGDKEFEKKLLVVMREELPTEMESYNDHMSNKNFTLAADLVHKIKHKINLLAMNEGYQTAQKLEENLRDGQIELHEEFCDILNRLLSFINNA